MLATSEIVQAVADALKVARGASLVVDPVMVSTSGHTLLQEDAIQSLKEEVFPHATIITPNLPEACLLLGLKEIKTVASMEEAARQLTALGPRWVLVKGGHLQESAFRPKTALTWSQAIQRKSAERRLLEPPCNPGKEMPLLGLSKYLQACFRWWVFLEAPQKCTAIEDRGTQPGFSTVPLKVRIEEPATGIRCCADAQGINIDCVDLQASATPGEFLSSPGTFRFPLVLQEPLEISDDPLNVNVSCAAMGESGLCAQNGTGPELGTFPCRQVEPLQVQLKAQPLAWKPPWRIPVNSTLGLEALAEPAGYASQLKAVEDETAPSGICKTLSSQHFHSLPCKGTECVDQDFARGQSFVLLVRCVQVAKIFAIGCPHVSRKTMFDSCLRTWLELRCCPGLPHGTSVSSGSFPGYLFTCGLGCRQGQLECPDGPLASSSCGSGLCGLFLRPSADEAALLGNFFEEMSHTLGFSKQDGFHLQSMPLVALTDPSDPFGSKRMLSWAVLFYFLALLTLLAFQLEFKAKERLDFEAKIGRDLARLAKSSRPGRSSVFDTVVSAPRPALDVWSAPPRGFCLGGVRCLEMTKAFRYDQGRKVE
eukprot:g21116.t1